MALARDREYVPARQSHHSPTLGRVSEIDPTLEERTEAVRAFDSTYGHMERTLWTLSQACRPFLLRGEESPVIDGLVWTLKSWMGVQGVRSETKRAMGAALASLRWAPSCFEESYLPRGEAETFACAVVADLVVKSMERGVARREYSLASKVLHWLMPWRVPIYDAFVRAQVGVPEAWDHPAAYRKICDTLFARVHEMSQGDMSWVGTVNPRSRLHGLDKWLWWAGGGKQGTAAVVTHPERVLRDLGLVGKQRTVPRP